MKLLDQVRQCLRVQRYAARTQQCYLRWILQYIRFHKGTEGYWHPATHECSDITTFLTYLTVERYVSAGTQNQALTALLFLYQEVSIASCPNSTAVGHEAGGGCRSCCQPTRSAGCWRPCVDRGQ